MNGMTSKLVLAFVAILIGVVLLTQSSTVGNSVTSTTSVVNDTLDVSTARQGAKAAGNLSNSSIRLALHTYLGGSSAADELGDTNTDCRLTAVSLRNASNATVPTDEYNITYSNTLGQAFIQLANASVQNGSTGNTSYMSYTYCPDGYITQSFGRTGVDVSMGLFAIAILMIGVGLFYSAYRDWKLG